MKKEDLAKACREFADYLDARDFGELDFTSPTFLIRAETPAEFKKHARAMGSFEKSADAGYFNAIRRFGEIKLELFIVRDLVCKRIEKGTRIIPGEPERVIPATPDRTEPMYEYECPDTILGLDENEEEKKEVQAALDAEIRDAEKEAENHGPELSGVPF